MDHKFRLKPGGKQGRGDDDTTESDTEEYSLLYVVPGIVKALPKLCYRSIIIIGDVWLGGHIFCC